jgi:hypothetical protein
MIVIYLLSLLPYIAASDYERYTMPLVAVKVFLVFWAAERLWVHVLPALVARRGHLATIVLLAAGTGLLGSGVTRAADGPAWPFEYSYDFRKGPVPPELAWFNAEEGRFFRSEPEGLRITIPRTWTHRGEEQVSGPPSGLAAILR